MVKGPSRTSSIPFDINVLTGTAIAGLVIKMFFGQNLSNDGGTGPALAAIWGYGVLVFSLVGVLVVTLALGSQADMQNSILDFIKGGLKNSMPVVLLMLVIGWLITMNVQFFTKINQGKVAPEYSKLSAASSGMIIFQILLLLKYLRDEAISSGDETAGRSILARAWAAFAARIGMFLYLLSGINLILAGGMQVVLQFFSTDG